MSACDVVRLDSQGSSYGVCSHSSSAEPSWVIFTGEEAERRAFAYAVTQFEDVKTGRLKPGQAPCGDVLRELAEITRDVQYRQLDDDQVREMFGR